MACTTTPYGPDMSSQGTDPRELVAHVLRRTSFGPFPGQVEERVGEGIPALLDAVLEAEPLDPGPTPNFDEDDDVPPRRWLGLMARREAGLHEKLTWFWHGHLTSSYDKIGEWKMLWKQHLLLRRHALGNFRELLQAITIDPAMLIYLDGDGSSAHAPNENYAREVMELFALGRGTYTQADVRAGARALAGWQVDWEPATSSFSRYSGAHRPTEYLGRSVGRADQVVDAICDHPACAPFIAAKLHRALAGAWPTPERGAELAAVFAGSGLEIRPLVEAILRDDFFLVQRRNRAREPVEWVVAAIAALGLERADLTYDTCWSLAQVPFYPPNVAGWPPGPRWLSASSALAQAALVVQADAPAALRSEGDLVGAALARCSLYEPSASTLTALETADAHPRLRHDPGARAAVVLGLAVASPEFALA